MPCLNDKCLGGNVCPVKANIDNFNSIKDQRTRIQLQVFKILRCNHDGSPIFCTREEENNALNAIAPSFAQIYDLGLICPNEIASSIESGLVFNILETLKSNHAIQRK